MNNLPIGILDSGLGGLSVWKEIDKLMPNESVIYFADSGNCPYGSKSEEEIIEYTDNITQFLINKQCKLIVVACNTATSIAIEHLRQKFDVPFVGIEPAIKPAAINSKTGVIGVLATSGTLKSKMFNQTKERFSGNIKVVLDEGNELVNIVENNLQGTQESLEILRKHIEPLMKENVDHLVLGCTHFPFLINDIKKITGNSVYLENPAPAVANRTKYILNENNIISENNGNTTTFYSTGNINILKNMVENIKGIEPNMTFYQL